MTTELCGYGDKCRKRTGHLMGWIDSRDRHRFAKHCQTTKGGSCSVSHLKHFSRCPPSQCSTYLALFVDALAFVLSTSAREQPSCSLIRDSGLGDVVWRAVCSRSLGLHVRRWPPHEPSCFIPCHASCSRQLCSLSRTANRLSCTIVDQCGCAPHDTFTEPGTFLCNFTLNSHLHGIAVCLSKFLMFSILLSD